MIVRRKIKTLTVANLYYIDRGRFDEDRKCRSGHVILHLHFIKMISAPRIFPLSSSNFSLYFHHMMKWEKSVNFVFTTLFCIFIPNINFSFLLVQKIFDYKNVVLHVSTYMCACVCLLWRKRNVNLYYRKILERELDIALS